MEREPEEDRHTHIEEKDKGVGHVAEDLAADRKMRMLGDRADQTEGNGPERTENPETLQNL